MALSVSVLALGGLVTAFLLILVSSWSKTRKRYALLGAEPPTVVPTKSFGLNIIIPMFIAVLKHRFYHWTKDLLQKHNHTAELRMLGQKLVLTDDPENIKAIQDTQFWEVAKSEEQHEIFKHILGDAIFAMNGEEWKAEAVLYKTHMSRIRDTDFEVTERHTLNAFKLLDRQGADAFDVIDRLQLDIVTEVFCGDSTNSLTSNQQPFRDSMEILQKIACFRQLLGKVGVWLDDKWLAPRAVQFIDDYQDAFADKAYARTGENPASGSVCLIDDLIRKGKSRYDIKNAVTSTLLAAKDPSTTTMAFGFYEIAKRPHVFAKMKAEVEEHIGYDRLPLLTDLHKLKYIKNVIKETLRDHHPLGFNARVALKDITLPRGGGPDGNSPVGVLEGTQIIYGLLSLQHRVELGIPDINEWKPERWDNWKPANKWDFVPFNHGPRVCLGQQFANFQMEYFLARLCQEYDSVTLLPESPPQEGLVKLELNTKMAHPVYAKCIRREDKA
ncbi:Cytochrome P450 monooxygenase ascH [Cladobotryum mycophilum]|uniref:Cytochrome P450 monooxygenase ascH n=1 Tax=Cladobotryum mycophilum TaxID=491253 RepID=A0ABR0T1N9_9HYPO